MRRFRSITAGVVTTISIYRQLAVGLSALILALAMAVLQFAGPATAQDSSAVQLFEQATLGDSFWNSYQMTRTIDVFDAQDELITSTTVRSDVARGALIPPLDEALGATVEDLFAEIGRAEADGSLVEATYADYYGYPTSFTISSPGPNQTSRTTTIDSLTWGSVDPAQVAEVETRRAAWDEAGLTDYRFDLDSGCGNCGYEAVPVTIIVEDGVVVRVESLSGEPLDVAGYEDLTIDDRFDFIATKITEPVTHLSVRWDGFIASYYTLELADPLYQPGSSYSSIRNFQAAGFDITPTPTPTPTPTVSVTPTPTVFITPTPTVYITPTPTVYIIPTPTAVPPLIVCDETILLSDDNPTVGQTISITVDVQCSCPDAVDAECIVTNLAFDSLRSDGFATPEIPQNAEPPLDEPVDIIATSAGPTVITVRYGGDRYIDGRYWGRGFEPVSIEVVVGEPEGPQPCGGYIQEAEQARIVGTPQIVRDDARSGGAYVIVPESVGSVYVPTAEHLAQNYFEFCVNVEQTAIFELQLDSITGGRNSDSFYLTVGDSELLTAHINSLHPVFTRNDAGRRVAARWTLEAGEQTIRFYPREDGSGLDKFRLQRVANAEPQPAGCSTAPTQAAADAGRSGDMILLPDGGVVAPVAGDYLGASEILNRKFVVDENSFAEFCFTVPEGEEGDYTLDALVWAPDGASNSFYVGVDDSAIFTWHTQIWEAWGSQPVRMPGTYRPRTYRLDAGDHVARLYVREPGTLLDSIQFIKQS